MSKPSFGRHMDEDARLVMLQELASQTDYRLTEIILHRVIEAYGHNRSRDYVKTQIRAMAELGAVQIVQGDPVMIVEIVQAGIDHVLRRKVVEGIARPTAGV